MKFRSPNKQHSLKLHMRFHLLCFGGCSYSFKISILMRVFHDVAIPMVCSFALHLHRLFESFQESSMTFSPATISISPRKSEGAPVRTLLRLLSNAAANDELSANLQFFQHSGSLVRDSCGFNSQEKARLMSSQSFRI